MYTISVEVKVPDKALPIGHKLRIFVIVASSEEDALEKAKKYGEPVQVIPNSKTKLSKDWR
jgi:hypothetical protein